MSNEELFATNEQVAAMIQLLRDNAIGDGPRSLVRSPPCSMSWTDAFGVMLEEVVTRQSVIYTDEITEGY